ncbi:hypothetical protein ACQ4PT_058514 [Festuca glaucescens]
MLLHLLFLGLELSASATSNDQFVYSGFTGANLTLDSVAKVTPNGLLELINGTAWLKGHACHPNPILFRKTANGTVQSFSASYMFAIYCVRPDICGHRIAFFVAASNNFSETMQGQYMGLVNNQTNGKATNCFFAVELDTNQNNEFQDINNNHVGIDVNGLNSVNSSSAGYYDNSNSNFHNLTLASYQVMQVWVDYDGRSKQIDVTLAPLSMAKPIKPLISTTYDLSRVLTDMVYAGFSSSTSSFISQQYVLGWSFSTSGPAPAIDITKLPRQGPEPRSKVLEIILPIVSAAFVIVAGTIIILLVRRRLKYAELREDWEVEFGPHRFSYKDLFHATEGFKDHNLLGVGGFGRVYKGVLPVSRLEIAAKRISHDTKQGMKEFVTEVVSIGRLQHRNLVQLHGYCHRKGKASVLELQGVTVGPPWTNDYLMEKHRNPVGG